MIRMKDYHRPRDPSTMPPPEERKTPERPSYSPITSPIEPPYSDQDQSSHVDAQHDQGDFDDEVQSEYEDNDSHDESLTDDAEPSEVDPLSPMRAPIADDTEHEDYDESPRPARKTRRIAPIATQVRAASTDDARNQLGGYSTLVRATRAQKKMIDQVTSEGAQGVGSASNVIQKPEAEVKNEDDDSAHASDDDSPRRPQRSARAARKKPNITKMQQVCDSDSVSSNSTHVSKKRRLTNGRSKATATRRGSGAKARGRSKKSTAQAQGSEELSVIVSVAVGEPPVDITPIKRFEVPDDGDLVALSGYKDLLPAHFGRELTQAGLRGSIDIIGYCVQDPNHMGERNAASVNWIHIKRAHYRAYNEWIKKIRLSFKDKSPLKVQVIIVDRREPESTADKDAVISAEGRAVMRENKKLKAENKRLNDKFEASKLDCDGFKAKYKELEEENEDLVETMAEDVIPRFCQRVKEQNKMDRLTKAVSEMALDLEYADAGYNPKDGLTGDEEAYWTRYLPGGPGADDTDDDTDDEE